jgi:hypothetical protein
MQLVEQLAIMLPFAVATVGVVIFASPCFVFAFPSSVIELDQPEPLILERYLECTKF